MPVFWPLPRKNRKFAVCPVSGPHPKSNSVPLTVVVRDIMGMCKTAKEAKKIVKTKGVLVDGKEVVEEKFPIGAMDVITIKDKKEAYLVVPDKTGFEFRKIDEKKAGSKYCKIIGKKMLKKGLQLNLHDGRNIVIPKDATERVEYEAELVVVIGKKAKNLTEKNALSCVLGYTIGNDMSERTWQKEDRTLWRAKNTDTFKPMGPWIDTTAKLEKMQTTVRVNGKETISFKTNHMLYSVQKYIARMSKYIELQPRDVIWMGTEGSSPQVRHGDVIDIEITGIGTLTNPVVRARK